MRLHIGAVWNSLADGQMDFAAHLLHEAGEGLRGKNLKRKTWTEIAVALTIATIGPTLLGRLEAATTREHALRVLRLARRWRRDRERGGGKGRRKGRGAARQTVRSGAGPEAPAWTLEDLVSERTLYEQGGEHADYLRWRARREAPAPPARPADLLPASPFDGFLRALATRLLEGVPDRPVVTREVAERLRAGIAPARRASPAAIDDLLERYRLARLRRLIDAPDGARPEDLAPVADGHELAALMALRLGGVRLPVLPADWPAIAPWLAERLAAPPTVDQRLVVLTFVELLRQAPDDVLAGLIGRLGPVPGEWGPLFLALYPRHPLRARRGRTPPTTERECLAAGFGSRLVLHCAALGQADARAPGVAGVDEIGWLPDLLLGGAATIRRMDYPTLALACRPLPERARLDRVAALAEVAGALLETARRVFALEEADLLGGLERLLPEPHRAGLAVLTPLARGMLSRALHRHVVAYVHLRRDVLREALRDPRFRIRARHVRRFWITPRPVRGGAARIEGLLALGREDVLEGLVHACLAHAGGWAHDRAGRPIPLKRPLLALARTLALVYRIRVPYELLQRRSGTTTHAYAPEWSVDVAQAAAVLALFRQEPANPMDSPLESPLETLLEQQFVEAPEALARALRIPGGQSFPRLQGRRTTPLEDRYRRVRRTHDRDGSPDADRRRPLRYRLEPITPLAVLADRIGWFGHEPRDRWEAVLPHRVHYVVRGETGAVRADVRLREVWAREGDAFRPALLVESCRPPLPELDPVAGELGPLLDALSRARGLAPTVVVPVASGPTVAPGREPDRTHARFREGADVTLLPADPIQPALCAFLADGVTPPDVAESRGRLLAVVGQGGAALPAATIREIGRLDATPPRTPVVTARTEDAVVGFISALPTLLA